jgi:GH15 family glucan-1,4-alpha-glucosidase
MAYTPTFVLLSSLKPLFFNSLKMRYASWTTREHKTPESNKSVGHLLAGVQIDPQTSAFLGNYPQAFSHVGLISSGANLARLTPKR